MWHIIEEKNQKFFLIQNNLIFISWQNKFFEIFILLAESLGKIQKNFQYLQTLFVFVNLFFFFSFFDQTKPDQWTISLFYSNVYLFFLVIMFNPWNGHFHSDEQRTYWQQNSMQNVLPMIILIFQLHYEFNSTRYCLTRTNKSKKMS